MSILAVRAIYSRKLYASKHFNNQDTVLYLSSYELCPVTGAVPKLEDAFAFSVIWMEYLNRSLAQTMPRVGAENPGPETVMWFAVACMFSIV